MNEPDFKGLGQRLRERRETLGLTPLRVGRLGGPSVVTLRKMERGEPVRRRLDTTFPLEQIYGWSPGSINGYLDHGTEPYVIREPDYSESAASSATVAGLAEVPTEVLEEALRLRKQSE